ncbi:unnamed protein product [Musa acuminata subsp. malaccensis]|uniref:(wild Malaysian banana) hypothetical protein n=1 Tax=Musa acuminata subsp. malaccensis TaxID=214687 RepID=A0A8D6ZV67_MUSAM|nr:unnamed protein product [Musa acuminata subsp. malaccensis]
MGRRSADLRERSLPCPSPLTRSFRSFFFHDRVISTAFG